MQGVPVLPAFVVPISLSNLVTCQKTKQGSKFTLASKNTLCGHSSRTQEDEEVRNDQEADKEEETLQLHRWREGSKPRSSFHKRSGPVTRVDGRLLLDGNPLAGLKLPKEQNPKRSGHA